MTLNITLNGNNYVSEKTRQAFEQALAERRREKSEEKETEPTGKEKERKEEREGRMEKREWRQTWDDLERVLAQSYEHQMLTMRVHELYLTNQGDYARLFTQLLQQQGTIFTQAATAPQQTGITTTVLETLSRSMERFHNLQEQTLEVHRQFLAQQSEYARATIQLLGNGEKPAIDGAWGKMENTPHRVKDERQETDDNGHHPQEIVSQAQEVRSPRPEAKSKGNAAAIHASPASAVVAPLPVIPSPVPPSPLPSSPTRSSPDLVPSLLAIVGEKTGYPVEMLDLTMDLEADLGIDSIKRVEILGALQDAHPDLPEVPTDVLAEMRTLGQIVEKLQITGNSEQEANPKPLAASVAPTKKA